MRALGSLVQAECRLEVPPCAPELHRRQSPEWRSRGAVGVAAADMMDVAGSRRGGRAPFGSSGCDGRSVDGLPRFDGRLPMLTGAAKKRWFMRWSGKATRF